MSRLTGLLTVLFLFCCAPLTQAQVIPVTVPFDIPIPGDGACTLREAITNANMDADLTGGDCPAGVPGLDMIFLPPGPITLDLAGPPEDLNASGDLDLLSPIHIEGVGPGVTIIDLTALGERGFQVHPSTSPVPTAFFGFSILGGAPVDPTDEGAAMKIEMGNFIFMGGVEFSLNTAQNNGGALFVDANVLVDMAACIFLGNQTTGPTASGGAIFNRGTISSNTSLFDQNMTLGSGGGIFNDAGGQLFLTGDQFSGNTAQGDGGGIFNLGVFSHNGGSIANGSAGLFGGGIFSDEGLDLDNLTISGNSSGLGGGIAFSGPSGTLDSVIVTNNDALFQGGGINNDSPSLTITGSTITLNETNDPTGLGGGIFNGPTGSISLVNSNLDENTAAAHGGGIRSEGALSLDGTSVADNIAGGNGGGINASGDLTLDSLTVSGNTAVLGGGIHHSGSNGQLSNMNIDGNTATTDGGGLYNSGTITLTDTEVLNNEATTNFGGGIYQNSNQVTLINSTLAENTAGSGGGGCFNAATLTITNSTISWNTSTSGGGLSLDPVSVTTLDSTTITNNGDVGVDAFGTTNFRHTIILGNTVSDCSYAGPSPTPTSFGYNLDGDGSCVTLLGNITDIPGGVANLGPLQNNGGPTRTHMLQLPSMAIDSGDPTGLDITGNPLTEDQRGEPRPTDGDGDTFAFMDRGAFERATFVSMPPPVPDGDFDGTAMAASRNNAGGTIIDFTWDAATCPGPDNHIIYGNLADVDLLTLGGGVCDLGTTGSGTWNSVPSGDLFFMVVADNDFLTEGNWGYSSDGSTRAPSTVSGFCSLVTKDNTNTCSP